MNRISVLFFASLRDRAGVKQIWIDLPEDAIIRDLISQLEKKYPALFPILSISLVAMNKEYATKDQLIIDGARSLYSPVSGVSLWKICPWISYGLCNHLRQIGHGQIDRKDYASNTGAVCVYRYG
jgi:molybdopterin converting factor small subunit